MCEKTTTEQREALPLASLDMFALIAECPGSGTGMDSFWWPFEIKGQRAILEEKCAELRKAAKSGAAQEMFATAHVVEITVTFSANK